MIEQGWAIIKGERDWDKRESHWIDVTSCRYTRRKAIKAFLTTSSRPWKFWYRLGYRAVRVLITDELWRVKEGELDD